MKNWIFGMAFFLAPVGMLLAQDIQFNIDPDIDQLLQTWIRQNRIEPGIDGWRLQLLSTTDRTSVESGKAQFLNLFPTVPADWVHEKPYYKLRIGAFRSRQEALSFLPELKNYYPGAYPARDPNIHPRDFLD
jgi:hypothetical protein